MNVLNLIEVGYEGKMYRKSIVIRNIKWESKIILNILEFIVNRNRFKLFSRV